MWCVSLYQSLQAVWGAGVSPAQGRMAECDGDIPPRMKAAWIHAEVTASWWFESTSFREFICKTNQIVIAYGK